MRYGLIVLWMLLCSATSAIAQVSVGIGLPGVSKVRNRKKGRNGARGAISSCRSFGLDFRVLDDLSPLDDLRAHERTERFGSRCHGDIA